MSPVEYLCSGTSAVEDRRYRKVAKLNRTRRRNHFSGTSFVVVRKYGGSSGADPLIHETSQRADIMMT